MIFLANIVAIGLAIVSVIYQLYIYIYCSIIVFLYTVDLCAY